MALSSLCTLTKFCARKSTTRVDSHGPNIVVRSMAQTEQTASVLRQSLYSVEQAIQQAVIDGNQRKVAALRRKAITLSNALHKKENES